MVKGQYCEKVEIVAQNQAWVLIFDLDEFRIQSGRNRGITEYGISDVKAAVGVFF